MSRARTFSGVFCLAALLFTGAPAPAQAPAAAPPPAASPFAKPSLATKPSPGLILTSNQLAALLTTANDEKSQTQLQFTSAFGVRNVSPDEKRKLAKAGKIPLSITCQLLEIKNVKGQQLARRLGGRAHFYIQDADGKVVVNKSESLDKMCPS